MEDWGREAGRQGHLQGELDTVKLVSQHDARQNHGDHGTGKDDTEGIRDWHEAHAGKAGDEGDGSYHT